MLTGVNGELLSYIHKRKQAGALLATIREELLQSGWQQAAVDSALSSCSSQQVQSINGVLVQPLQTFETAPSKETSKTLKFIAVVAGLLLLLSGILAFLNI